MKKIITMHRNDRPFQWELKGTKRIEGRINDSKRKSINVGDYLLVKNGEKDQEILFQVKAKREYKTFKEMTENEELRKLGEVKTVQEYLHEVFKYYSADEEMRYGVVAIEVSEPLAVKE